MKKTYTELLNMMERNNTHTKISGWTSELDAGDMVNGGITSILATSKSTTAEGIAEGKSSEAQTERPGEVEEEAELFKEDFMLDDL